MPLASAPKQPPLQLAGTLAQRANLEALLALPANRFRPELAIPRLLL